MLFVTLIITYISNVLFSLTNILSGWEDFGKHTSATGRMVWMEHSALFSDTSLRWEGLLTSTPIPFSLELLSVCVMYVRVVHNAACICIYVCAYT